MTQAPEAGSSIYDLGYRHYEGERLGRWWAVLALYRESLRGAFGLGRSASAKVGPLMLAGIALFPVLIQLAISAISPVEAEIVRHAEYYGGIKFILALYCGVVAPDIAGRDQRNRSLTLYFTRAISRTDYALGKLAAMTTAMLLITLLPQVLLFAGNALATQDFGAYLKDEWTLVAPIIGSALLGSFLIAAIGVTIAAHTPHRAFATAGIIVAFILPIVVAGVLVFDIGTEATRYAIFLSPLDLVDGFTAWMFREAPDPGGVAAEAGFGLWSYGLVAVVVSLAASVLLVRRYRSVQA